MDTSGTTVLSTEQIDASIETTLVKSWCGWGTASKQADDGSAGRRMNIGEMADEWDLQLEKSGGENDVWAHVAEVVNELKIKKSVWVWLRG